MSCCSTNTLPAKTSKASLFRLIELLGYEKQRKVSNESANYFWCQDDINGISLTGVELSVYKSDEGILEVYTRTRSSRGYWDVQKQYQTIKAIQEYLGGTVKSDYNNGWVDRASYVEPTKLEYGLYKARARFNVSSIKINLFFSCREMTGAALTDTTSGIDFIDDMNLRFLSNALLIPYCVAIWEDYLKSSYLMILRHSNLQEKTMSKISMDSRELNDIINGRYTIEEVCADRLSFQRPHIIAQNFKNLGVGIDVGAPLKEPFNRRAKSLFDSIDEYVNMRNEIAHTGSFPKALADNDVLSIVKDFTAAVDRIYDYFGKHFCFTPKYDF